MNMSQLITRIKISLGLYTIALPFENPEEAIKETLQNITLRTFSTYCPHYEKIAFNCNELQKLEKNAHYEVYLLPDIFQEKELLFIRNIDYDEADITGMGYWGGTFPILQGSLIRQAMLSNASLGITQKMIPKITFKYEHPRKVTLYNRISSSHLVFELAFTHDKNLQTITPTEEETFFQLALLDIKDMLYQSLKHYNDIQTAFGNINMKLDDWSSAAQERKELLNEWEQVYHMDILPFEYA